MWLCVVSLEQNLKSLKGQTDFRSNINEDRGSLQNITEQNRLEESMFPYTINSSCDPISPTALTHRSQTFATMTDHVPDGIDLKV